MSDKKGLAVNPGSNVRYSESKARQVIETQARHIKETEHAKGNSNYSYEQARKVAIRDQLIIDRKYGK